MLVPWVPNRFNPYPSGLPYRHRGHFTIGLKLPMKQPWIIRVTKSDKSSRNLWYKQITTGYNYCLRYSTVKYLVIAAPIPTLQCFSSCLAVVSAQSIEAMCWFENEDVVVAAPTGDAPNTSEWSTIVLPTKVRIILEVCRYIWVCNSH